MCYIELAIVKATLGFYSTYTDAFFINGGNINYCYLSKLSLLGDVSAVVVFVFVSIDFIFSTF